MSTSDVPVPATCSAALLVLTPEPLDHEDEVPLPHAAVLKRHGTSDAMIERFLASPHRVALQTRVPTTDIAPALRDLRIRALDLAAQHDGVVLDLTPPRVLDLTPAQVSLAHATQWYVSDLDGVAVDEVRTDGLEQFGLPEVLVPSVTRDARAMVDAVVAGLVHRLIEEWPEQDPVGPATVTLQDVAFGLGDPQAADTTTDRAVTLGIDYSVDRHRLVLTLFDDPATALFA